LPATEVRVLKEANGGVIDGAEIVARYIRAQPNATLAPVDSRIKLLRPLPPARFGFKEVQPLRGAQP
jgi:hypothetical protein